MVIQINSKPLGKSISPSTPAQISPKENCIRVSQNKMQVIVSVLVSSLVAIEVTAKPIAHKAAEIIAGSKAEKLGLATINIPTKPIAIDKNLTKVSFSFKNIGARTATQIGTENSIGSSTF